MHIALKRVYEKPSESDGKRVLVDRLWPRGLTKERARVDVWLKEVAPSTELRKWFNHEPSKWPEFKKRYKAEMSKNQSAISALSDLLTNEKVTVLYGAKDQEHNEALVIKEYFEKRS